MTKVHISGSMSVSTAGLRGAASLCVVCMVAFAARGQQKPCCTITAVDARTAVVTARVTATAQLFQFKVSPAIARSLRPGQSVYANLSNRQASLDGRTVCCTIIAVSRAPVQQPATAQAPASTALAKPQSSVVGQAASSTGTGTGTGPGSYVLPTPSSVTFAPASVTGGSSSTATVTLTGAAPQNGLQISLASNQPGVVTVPPKISVPGGNTSASVSLGTRGVPLKSGNGNDDPVPIVISASGAPSEVATISQVVTKTGTLFVLPPIVTSLGVAGRQSLSQGPMGVGRCAAKSFSDTGGYSLDGCVLLNGPAADEAVAKTVLGGQSTISVGIGELGTPGARVNLSSSNSQIASVPATMVVPVGKTQGSFKIATKPVQTATTLTISAHRTDSDARSLQLTLVPPTLGGLQCNPATVTGGESLPCSLTLTGPAYAGAIVILQFSSTQGLINPATSVTFEEGKSTATFGFLTTPVAADVTIGVTASFGGVDKSLTLQIQAPRPQSLSFNPSNPVGGMPDTGTVVLTGDAPNSGIHVVLSSDKPTVASVPPVLQIAGQPGYAIDKAQFPITTHTVSSDTDVTISASYAGTTVPATLKVRAAPLPDLYTQAPYAASGSDCQTGTSPTAGQTQPFTFYPCVVVGNQGQAQASATTVTASVSSSDGSFSAQLSGTVPQLAADSSVRVYLSSASVKTLTANPGVTYTITACVNPNHSISESTYADNCQYFSLEF